MEKGWNAKGRLRPLWGKVGGRDKLAAITGIAPGTLSGYNTGRLGLGVTNAHRIAEALGVTLLDLGVEEPSVAARAVALHDRVAELEADLAELRRELDVLRRRQDDGP